MSVLSTIQIILYLTCYRILQIHKHMWNKIKTLFKAQQCSKLGNSTEDYNYDKQFLMFNMQIQFSVFMLYTLLCMYLHILILIVNVTVEDKLLETGIYHKCTFSLHFFLASVKLATKVSKMMLHSSFHTDRFHSYLQQ